MIIRAALIFETTAFLPKHKANKYIYIYTWASIQYSIWYETLDFIFLINYINLFWFSFPNKLNLTSILIKKKKIYDKLIYNESSVEKNGREGQGNKKK
jgi:hypothetical protein